ncbi:Nonribosomal peptide synthetase dtxS1 [Lachnellula suecica]|uniref:Nonribosomal peptide synthetase dtxS1 n=1 Tax=Lachnellula suecica TaxID=602035 RepID=A0A8T9CRU4_9HELO|nr:Nonribosomal peptide synthetase dtxS1 [Lachnellula suecica]
MGTLTEGLKTIDNMDSHKIWTWNAKLPKTLSETCVHDMILRWAKSSPKSQALCASDGDLSYGELDDLSFRLASYLVSIGAGEGTIIPLCFEKSLWTVVSIMGTLRAGAAFLLLDAVGQPEARIATILQQIKLSILLTSPSHEVLARRLAPDVFVVSDSTLRQQPVPEQSLFVAPIAPTSALYVVFTSGSTGTPKGAVITHENYLSGAIPRGKYIGYNDKTRAFDFASYSFDTSIERNLNTLIHGGTVCIPSEEARMDVARSINSMRANVVGLTPSVARILRPESVPGLEMMIFGGESAAIVDMDLWSKKMKTILIYGPAECSIATTVTKVYPGAGAHELGQAIGAKLWIVDQDDPEILLPIGHVGELLVEGPIVGKYLDDANNSKSFLNNPGWLLKGAEGIPGRQGRLYCTGDLARYNELDGSVVFFGRKDTQVKIRGQRVELEEVESHLRRLLSQDTVLAAEVIMPSSVTSRGLQEPTLAAFVVEKKSEVVSGQILETQNVSNNLADSRVDFDNSRLNSFRKLANETNSEMLKALPKHMVPALYIPLTSIPMTVSLKTDRKRLRTLGQELSSEQLSLLRSVQVTKRPPETENERKLQQLWSSVLRIAPEEIGMDDNFFELGGDSIAGMKLVTLASKSSLPLTSAAVFKYPSLSELAHHTGVSEESFAKYEPFVLLGNDHQKMKVALEEISNQCATIEDSIVDAYPCTPLQEGLMALSMKRKGNYVVQRVIELGVCSDSELDNTRSIWQSAIETSAIMRTRIVHVRSHGMLQIVVKDTPGWIYAENLASYLQKDRSREMGFGVPLMRHAIISGGDGRRSLVFTLHHAVYDAWSWSLFKRRIDRSLAGLTEEPPAEYGRFVKLISNPSLVKASETFWRSELQGFQGASYPALPFSTYEPAAVTKLEYRINLSPKVRHSITRPNMIRAAWSIVVKKIAGQEDCDIVFGTSLMGRNVELPGIENVEGPTIATIPVRTRVNPNMSVFEFLEAIQGQATRTLPHEHLGLQNIRKLNENTRAACGFQTLIVVQPMFDIKAGGFALDTEVDEPLYSNTYALTLVCWLTDDGILVEAIFDASVIPAVVMERNLRRMDMVMKQLWDMPEAKVGTIDCMTPEEKSQIWQWNQIVPEQQNELVHRIIERQAALIPEEPAIDAWDGQLSYRELDRLSSMIASHLSGRFNVKSEVIVSLLFEKSMWAVVTMFAVMKVGGSFLLLDTAQPEARLKTIVEQVENGIIVTSPLNQSLAERLTSKVVTLSELNQEYFTGVSLADIKPSISSDLALYVVFTSGTTGQPKGVVITNANFASGVQSRKHFLLPNNPRVLDFASYSFDASIECILSSLMVGGCVVEPSDEIRKNTLSDFINEKNIDVVDLTPSVARLLDPKQIPGVKVIKLAGEAVGSEDVKSWSKGAADLVVAYGPAECSVASVAQPHLTEDMNPRNIGRGIGAVTWLVDASDHECLVPLGAVGELLLEGPVVGRGYLGDKQQTDIKFIPSPSWLVDGYKSVPGRSSRLYKTGDLVRYEPDGSLVYVGRKDLQVKLRGQRIELGDIEHHLSNLLPPGVEVIAEVVIPKFIDGQSLLVACISECAPPGSFENNASAFDSLLADVNEKLEKLVPSYMIPTMYVPIAKMPLTSSGKIDRRQLREVAKQKSLAQGSDVFTSEPPQTQTEKALHKLWVQVLDIAPTSIGIESNFFKLGGESISAMKLVRATRHAGLGGLNIAVIFLHPKLRGMSGAIEAHAKLHVAGIDTRKSNGRSTGTEIPAFSLLGSEEIARGVLMESQRLCSLNEGDMIEDIYPCTSMQEGLTEFSLLRPRTLMIQTVKEIPDNISIERVQRAWESVVSSSAILRTTIIRSTALGLLQVVKKSRNPIEWTIEEDLAVYLAKDLLISIELGKALNRYALINDRTTGKSYTVWTAHHSTYDGWSMVLVQQRLKRALEGHDAGSNTPFKNYIKYINSGSKKESESYWRSALSGRSYSIYPNVPRETQPSAKEWVFHHMSTATNYGTSDFTVPLMIRAAWSIVVARRSNSEEVLFGETLAGRDSPVDGIENIEGPTFAVIPVRQRVGRTLSAVSFLELVQRQKLEMMPHEHVGSRTRRLGDDALAASMYTTMLATHPRVIGDAEKVVLNGLSSDHPMAIMLTNVILPSICIR